LRTNKEVIGWRSMDFVNRRPSTLHCKTVNPIPFCFIRTRPGICQSIRPIPFRPSAQWWPSSRFGQEAPDGGELVCIDFAIGRMNALIVNGVDTHLTRCMDNTIG